jgi:hypothetical protein
MKEEKEGFRLICHMYVCVYVSGMCVCVGVCVYRSLSLSLSLCVCMCVCVCVCMYLPHAQGYSKWCVYTYVCVCMYVCTYLTRNDIVNGGGEFVNVNCACPVDDAIELEVEGGGLWVCGCERERESGWVGGWMCVCVCVSGSVGGWVGRGRGGRFVCVYVCVCM